MKLKFDGILAISFAVIVTFAWVIVIHCAFFAKAHADTITVAVQSDALPTQTYSGNIGILYGVWTLSTYENAHGFELNAITNQVSSLNVSITAQGFTDAYTGFATMQQYVRTLPSGWSVTESLYYDALNRPFQGTLLDSDTFTAPMVAPGLVETYSLVLGTPFSMTAVFNVTSSGVVGELTSDINIGHTVPGPIVGAGLPGLGAMLMWLLWRRRYASHLA